MEINATFAEHFAADWIDSWNCHDLNRVLSHYTEDFEMSSPKIVQIAGEPTGTLKGKAAISSYWIRALQLLPDLNFELMATLLGINSITLYYKSVGNRMAAEVFQFNASGKVVRAWAHYSV
jgi:hypothetical protein